MNPRRPLFLAIFLIVLYVVAFVVRAHATQNRLSAGHGDVAGYYHVAKNLATGRGFVQDVVAEYLTDPRAIPTPSNTWWLPLPSIIASIGMRIAGDTEYVSAKYAMIAVSSSIPLLVFFAGWFLLRSMVAGVASGILAVGFHLYLDQPNATLSHGPYALFAGAGLLVVMAWREHRRILPWFGLCFGLTYLCRGDGLALVVGLAFTLFAEWRKRRREGGGVATIPWRSLALALGLFVAIAAPWWVRNQRVIGEPMPSGVTKIMWARNYEDWFVSDTSRLNSSRYREWGWDNILDQKWVGVRDALIHTPLALYRSLTREQGPIDGEPEYELALLCKWGLTPLCWLGLIVLLVKRPAAIGSLVLHLALLTAIYGILFPAIGRESYRSSLFSVFPIFMVAIVAGLSALLTPLEHRSPRASRAALIGLAIVLSAGNVVTAMPYLRSKYSGVESMLTPYRAFAHYAEARGIANETFMVRNPWEFTVETGMKAAILPNDAVKGILDRVKLYGAKYLIDENPGGSSIMERRPVIGALIKNGTLAPAFPRNPVPGVWRLYEFR